MLCFLSVWSEFMLKISAIKNHLVAVFRRQIFVNMSRSGNDAY